jgi:type II secretory pathway predicted ATPase ExeA
VTTEGYPHLLPEVTETLSLPAEQRIRFNSIDRFVRYPLADEILGRLERLRTRPRTIRPQSILLSGPAGNGKTALLEEFLETHRSANSPVAPSEEKPNLLLTGQPGSGKTALLQELVTLHPGRSTPSVEIKPVVRIEATSPGEGRLLSAILRGLGYDEDWDRGTIDAKLRRVLNGLHMCHVELLAIDEFHNMLNGGKRMYESLRIIKTISNLLQLPIVLSGTEDALTVLRNDRQLLTRFEVVKLPLWEDNQAYIDFLYRFEATLSLSKPSHLYSKEKAPVILELSKALDPERKPGVLYSVIKLVRLAAEAGLRDGSERIEIMHLRQVAEDNRYPED